MIKIKNDLIRETGQSFISRDNSIILKMIAIILMLVHHFFTFPVFYIEGINYDYLEPFADFFRRPTKICVSIFAFLTGWSYFYNKNKTIKYSFIKITLLLINFWIICIPFLITAILLGVYKANSVNITLELLGLNHEVMIFSWYVYFYVISMIMLPFIYKLLDKNIFIAFIPGCILPMIVFQFICKIYADNSYINEVSYNLSLFFPCISIGYLFAKNKIFEQMTFRGEGNTFSNIMVYISIIAFVIVARHFEVMLDMFSAPIFIFAFVNISNNYILNNRVTRFIGKQSTNIWFLHCAFFASLGQVFQPFAFFPKNPLLVILWVTLICTFVSFGISNILSPINKYIKALFNFRASVPSDNNLV